MYIRKKKENLTYFFLLIEGWIMTRVWFGENAHPACDKKKQQEHLLVFVKTLLVFKVDPWFITNRATR